MKIINFLNWKVFFFLIWKVFQIKKKNKKNNIIMHNKFVQLFDASLKQYQLIIESIENFVNDISRAIISNDASEYESLMKSINETKREISEVIIYPIPKLTDPVFIEITFVNDSYNKFSKLDTNLTSLLKLFSNKSYINYRNANISVTAAVIEESDRQSVIESFNYLKQINIKNDVIIFTNIEKELSQKEKKGNLVIFLMKNRNINRFTIFLMGIAIKTTSYNNRILLEKMIEEYKSTSLDSIRSDNYMLSRSNLFPLSSYKSFNKEIIEGIVESGNVNLFVMNIKSQHEFEYNTSLIYVDYASENNANRVKGLNEEFIKKTLTISDIDATKNNKKGSLTVNKYFVVDNKPCMFMEIMANKYRFLTTNSYLFANKKNHLFDNAVFRDKKYLSGRPASYNKETYVDCIDKQAIFIKDKYEKRPEIKESTDFKKQKLHEEIIKLISDNPKTSREFRYPAISSEQLTRIFTSVFVKPHNREAFYIYYIRIYNIVNEFIKRLRKDFLAIKINNNVFIEYDSENIKKYFQNERDLTVKNILNAMDDLRLFSQFDTSLKEMFIHMNAI